MNNLVLIINNFTTLKTLKFSIKVLMAMLLFCLPFAITSCCSDDDDEPTGPKTYTYEWKLSNTTFNNGTTEQKEAALIAEKAVNAALIKEFGKLGTINSSNQTLTISDTEGKTTNETYNDAQVTLAYETASMSFKESISALPDNARITIKRGNTKVVDKNLK